MPVLSLPLIVSGTITDSDSNNPSGIPIVIRNDRTIENISVTTNASGQYAGDLGNLASGWNVGDQITVVARYGLEEGEGSFTINSGMTGQTVNITTSEISASSDVTYCTIQEVYDELDGKTTSDIAANIIRDKILRSEAFIDSRTKTSFKANTFTDEIYNTSDENMWCSPESLLGLQVDSPSRADAGVSGKVDTIKLRHRPIVSITSLYRNTATTTESDSWSELTEQSGSGGDFVLNKRKGEIVFINNKPYYGKLRAMKVSGTWGLDRTSTDQKDIVKRELVRELCILLTVRQVIGQKGHSSQFDSQDNISLESISITTSVTQLTSYLRNIDVRINDLFESLGVFNVDMGVV